MYELLYKVQEAAAYARKAVIGATTVAAVIAAQYAPELSDEVSLASQFAIAVLGTIATFKATNGPQPL